MRRLYIVVEGQTEQSFVNEVLAPYLYSKGVISVVPIIIQTSRIGRGGFVNYIHLKNKIRGLLSNRNASDIIVTTFVDFFRMPTSMPNYVACMQENPRRVARLRPGPGAPPRGEEVTRIPLLRRNRSCPPH